MSKYIVDMPEGWSCPKRGNKELICPFPDYEYGCADDCPLAKAVEAVGIDVSDLDIIDTLQGGEFPVKEIGGKPVNLYAAKVEEK